jgi:quercetin dioxygenase-like cupin family protein
MNVINHTMLPRQLAEGCCSQVVAGAALCQAPFEVQVLTLDAGAATVDAVQPHARVVLVLGGSGKLLVDGGPQRFAAPCTLLIPAGARHQFVNNAATPMQLVAVSAPPAPAGASQP